MEKLLIVGCGDVARRALPELLRRYRVSALVRALDPSLVSAGAELVEGDLDRAETLAVLPAGASRIAHFAPPAEGGRRDVRTRALLAALEHAARRGEMLPQRFVYLSTSAVPADGTRRAAPRRRARAARVGRAPRRRDRRPARARDLRRRPVAPRAP